MSSSVIDLGSSGVHLPEHLGLDTNVLATRFVLPARITAGDAARRARVRAVFTAFRAKRVAGVVTSIVLMERIHVAIKSKYIADLPAYAHIIGGRRSWELLYKARPDLIQTYRPHLRRLLRSLRVSGLTILQPEDLQPLGEGRRFADG